VVGEREVFIRCSVGAAAAPRGAPADATLLTQADLARREANAAGGNAVRLYDAAKLPRGVDRLQIEHDLHHALARRELNVFYQPQVDARTRELVGFEALMRWQRAGATQPAARFIEIAEDTGLIVPMGEWAIGEACAALAAMRAAGLSRCLMSINLSCQQLRNGRLPGVVTDAARRHGLTCADLEVELTETGIMRDADGALQALAQLRSHGAGVAVDDFGTGYSSLAYLTRLPLTTLKIDRSFVRDVQRSRQSCAVARAIVSMGGHLGLRVIAEGVETEAQRAALIELGCPLQQGYLHGHAVALDEALRWAEPTAGGNR
jgi:EAL domain-containing protein (putative c-di-GMP-specific phosphodiesterase class I)